MTAPQKRPKDEVCFYTYPKFLFCWPMVVIGFLLWPIANNTSMSNEVLAWIWSINLLVVLLTLGFDLDRNKTIFWLVLIGGLWMLVLWLKDVKGLTVFSKIYRFFADLDPVYSASMGLILSIVLLIFWMIMWFWTRVNCKWRITHNEFEHYQLGRIDDSLARGAKRVATSYPDFFELVLCMAGELIIYDSIGNRELRRIPHVPFLPFVKTRINRMLEVTAVTAGQLEDEIGSDEEDDDQL